MPPAIMRGSAFSPPLCEALEFDQLGVDAAAGEQFGVSALLGDAALLDDQNTVGVVYGAQAVGYDYRRTSLEQGGEGLLHEFLALGVEGRGGLVEDQYLVKSWALATRAAASICSSVTSVRPMAMLLRMVSLKRMVSCETIPMCARRLSCV